MEDLKKKNYLKSYLELKFIYIYKVRVIVAVTDSCVLVDSVNWGVNFKD